MSELGFTLFDSAIGRCGVVWSDRGIAGVQLPERNEQATRSRVQRRYPGALETAPPENVRDAIAAVRALLAGERTDLSAIALDLDAAPDFNRRVYDVARSVPPGATISYGEIAARLGDRALAREVAEALSQNPCPLIVPCHRVLAAGGKTGGFSAPGGVATKLRLLTIEGAQPEPEPMLFDRLPLQTQRRRTAR